MSPWIRYSLLRLGLFGIVFGLLFVLLPAPLESIGITGFAVVVIAAAVAAVISLAVSYIFFGGLRDAVAADLAQRRERAASDRGAAAVDAAAEDAALDAPEGDRA